MGPVNRAQDPLVCTVYTKNQQSQLKNKKKKRQTQIINVECKRHLNL